MGPVGYDPPVASDVRDAYPPIPKCPVLAARYRVVYEERLTLHKHGKPGPFYTQNEPVEPILSVPDGLSARPVGVISGLLGDKSPRKASSMIIARLLDQNLPTRAALHHP